MRLPKGNQVDKALRSATRQVQAVQKGVNQQAARALRRGRYGEAESLVGTGRSVAEFMTQIEELRLRWKALAAGRIAGNQGAVRPEALPLWQYYQPILRALVALGGEASRREIEIKLPALIQDLAKPADLAEGSNGLPHWKAMLRKARRAMVQEGFLEARAGTRWRLTAKGREAAESDQPNRSR